MFLTNSAVCIKKTTFFISRYAFSKIILKWSSTQEKMLLLTNTFSGWKEQTCQPEKMTGNV